MIVNPNHPKSATLQNIVSGMGDSFIQLAANNMFNELRRDELFNAFQIITCFEFDALCQELRSLHYWSERRTTLIGEMANDDSAMTLQRIKRYGDACTDVAIHNERACRYRVEIQEKMGMKAWEDAKLLYQALTGCNSGELEFEVM